MQPNKAIDEVLKNNLISVIERDDGAGLYRFRIGKLQAVVTVNIKRLDGGFVEYASSHGIKTPEQADAYFSSNTTSKDWASALEKAIEDLLVDYRAAVAKGYQPEESWLVPRNAG